jgi:hypothetical protein
VYRENATLGVDKLGYFVASGIKQKNIQDTLELENFLGLNNITPMQSSHTQTAEDRANEDSNKDNESPKEKEGQDDDSVLEPAEEKSNPTDSNED